MENKQKDLGQVVQANENQEVSGITKIKKSHIGYYLIDNGIMAASSREYIEDCISENKIL